MEKPDKDNLKELYTISEISELAGISEQEIIRLIMLKELKAVKIGKSIRISESEFENFLKKLCGILKSDDAARPFFGRKPKEYIFYTAEQVAKILQLSVDNVLLLLQKGMLKGFKIRDGRSSWRISAECLEEFIENRSDYNAVH